MITKNSQKVNTENAVECQFGNAIKEPGICRLLKTSNIRKKKGGSVFDIFQFLLLLVFQNCNLYHFLNSKKQDMAFSKNTYYRFLNEPRYNWKRFLTLLAVRVTGYFNSLTKSDRMPCLALDDSVIPRERSKKVELLSRVYDHVIHKTVKGFNLLTLGWTDGYSFVPVGFNMMASADAKKRVMPVSDSIDKRKAGYVLMDTWFTNEPFIKELVTEGIDMIGMLKDNKQRYWYKGRLYNLKRLAMFVDFNTQRNIFGSVCVKTGKDHIPVKLVFVKNQNKKNEYIVLLTTDCGLPDREVVRIYGRGWSIEVFFRAGKSLLDLGDEFQGLSYDLTVSSTALVFTRYIILEWIRRKNNDQKTIRKLFYVCCDDIQDIELSTALGSLFKILCDGIRNRAITITNEVKMQLINWFVSQPAFIKALYPDFMWEV